MTAWMTEAALRGMLLAAIVGLGLSVLRIRNVPVRKAAWTLVLLASMAMPALMHLPAFAAIPARFTWTVPIRLTPAVPSHAVTRAARHAVIIVPIATRQAAPRETVSEKSARVSVAPLTGSFIGDAAPANRPPTHWPSVARMIVCTWLAVGGALLLRLLIGLAAAVRLWTTASLVSPLIAPEPNVRSSARITSPVTIGSGVVLPADYTAWDRSKLRMVLAHERSHVRQLDFYLQILAGLYTAVFWFSPLGWWLRRTLSSLGEAISDRAGLDAAASRAGYARIILEFAALPRKALPGVAMARSGNLTRRVESMLNEHLFRSAFAVGRRRALASLLLIPAALFVATALVRLPVARAQSAPTPPSAPTAPTAQTTPTVPTTPSAAPAAPITGVSAPDQSQVTTINPAPEAQPAPEADPEAQTAPAPQAAPVAPPPPPPAPAADQILSSDDTTMAVLSDGNGVSVQGDHPDLVNDGESVNGYGFHFSSDGDSYAVIQGPGNKFTFSGDWSPTVSAQIEQARRMTNGPILWFTHQGKSYIVTDPALIAQIEQMYRPMEKLNSQQDALGKQQEALGKVQEEMERAQEQAGVVRMPDLSKEMADLNASMAKMKVEQDSWDTKQLADIEASLKADQDKMLTSEKMAEIQEKLAQVQEQGPAERMAEVDARLAELQSRLGQMQGEAGEKQGAYGTRMGGLGKRQGALGEQEGKLGEEQGRMAMEIDRQVQKIIHDTLQNGKAKPVQ